MQLKMEFGLYDVKTIHVRYYNSAHNRIDGYKAILHSGHEIELAAHEAQALLYMTTTDQVMTVPLNKVTNPSEHKP